MLVRIVHVLAGCILIHGCGGNLPSKPLGQLLGNDDATEEQSNVVFQETHQYEDPTIPEEFAMDGGGLAQHVTLTGIYEAATAQRIQMDRPIVEETLYQGSSFSGTLSSEFLLARGFAGTPDMKVTVDSVPVDKSQFKMEKATKKIVFGNPPPEQAMINIRDRADLPLPKAFSIDPAAARGGLKVLVNGAEVTGAWMDAATGELNFSQPPTDGAKIDVVYNRVVEPTLTYPFKGVAKTPILRALTDIESGQVVAGSLTVDDFEINDADYVDGRKIAVNYSDGELATTQVMIGLDHTAELVVTSNDSACTPEPALVRVKADPKDEPKEPKGPKAPKEPKEPKEPKAPKGAKEPKESKNFDFKDGVLTVKCALKAETAFTVQVVKKQKPRFEVPVEGGTAWSVKIDGEPMDEFHLEENFLVIDAEMPAAAEIELTYTN